MGGLVSEKWRLNSRWWSAFSRPAQMTAHLLLCVGVKEVELRWRSRPITMLPNFLGQASKWGVWRNINTAIQENTNDSNIKYDNLWGNICYVNNDVKSEKIWNCIYEQTITICRIWAEAGRNLADISHILANNLQHLTTICQKIDEHFIKFASILCLWKIHTTKTCENVKRVSG